MTREEKIAAFTMRLDGYTCREIGERMGYTGQDISGCLLRVLSGRKSARCIYPELSRWMREHGFNMVRLAEEMNYAPATLYSYLGGYKTLSPAFLETMERVTGLSREAFSFPTELSGEG